MHFSELLEGLIGKSSQGAVAADLGIDASRLSKVRGGEAGLTLAQIDKALQMTSYGLHKVSVVDDLEKTVATIMGMWQRAKGSTK